MPIPPPASDPRSPSGRRTERLAWLAVTVWVALIFAAIPYARALERSVGGLLGGPRSFLVLGIGLVLAGISLAALHLYRSRAARSGRQYLWLAAVAAAFLGYATRLKVPVEALHFVEYTVLSLLVFRALSLRIHDRGVYLCSILICASIGVTDELLQWITPDRFGDLSDVALNLVASGLVQLALWKGIAPHSIGNRWGRSTLRVAVVLAAVLIVLLLAWAAATPANLAALSRHHPSLVAAAANPSVLAEYGHLHFDPEIGSFYSRFGLAELAEIDASRGEAAAEVLDLYRDPTTYPQFLVEHNSGTSPFIHEARVHLFRRNRFLDRLANESDTARQRDLAITAWREQRIMERYFPTTLSASTYSLTANRRAVVEARVDPEADYRSKVGDHLITAVSERQIRALLLLLLVGLTVAFVVLGRGASQRQTDSTPNPNGDSLEGTTL